MKSIILLVIYILFSLEIQPQNILNVPSEYSTIQSALNAAQTGDTVLVQSGTYYENIIWPDKNGIKLFGESSDNTIIDGSNNSTVLYIARQNIIIDTTTVIGNLKLTNGGSVLKGGGLYCREVMIKFESIAIDNNSESINEGGGVFAEGSELFFENCSISNT